MNKLSMGVEAKVPNDSLSKKVFISTASQVVSQVIVAALGVVALKIMTNALGVQSYGVYVTALVFVSTFSLLSDLGLNAITAREIAQHPEDANDIIGHNMGLRLFLCLIMVPVISLLGYIFYPHANSELRLGILLLTLYLFFDAMRSVALAYFTAKVRNDVGAIVNVIQQAIYLGCIILVVFAGWKLYGFYIAYIVANVAGAIAALYMASKFVRAWPTLNVKAWRAVFGMSLSLGVIQIINVLYLKADSILLSIYKGSVEVGIYGIAYSIVLTFMTLPGFIMTALTPSMSVTKNNIELSKIVEEAFNYMMIFACLLVVGSLIVQKDIILAVSSASFLAASAPFAILSFASAFSYLNNVFGFASVSVNKHHKLVFVSFVTLLLNVILNLFLIPLYSINGAAWATVVCEILSLIFTYWVFIKETKLKPKLLKYTYKPLIAAVVVFIFYDLFRLLLTTQSAIANLVIESVFVLVLYTAALYLMGGFPLGVSRISSLFKKKAA